MERYETNVKPTEQRILGPEYTDSSVDTSWGTLTAMLFREPNYQQLFWNKQQLPKINKTLPKATSKPYITNLRLQGLMTWLLIVAGEMVHKL